MRVLVISNMYPSKKSATFGIFVKNQVNALIRSGIDVDVLAIDNPNSTKRDIITKYLAWLLKGFLFLLKGYKYDVIHVHYVFPSGMLGLAFKKIWKSKMVVTAHGGDIDKMAKKSPAIKKWTFNILTKADHVIAVGQGLYQEINTDFKVDNSKLSLLSMGINGDVFKPYEKISQLKHELTIPLNAKSILFVGNIIPDKGVKELIKAYSRIKEVYPETELHLVGTIKSMSFQDELNAIIENENIKDISFEGPLSQPEVSKWMNVSDVLVLPSFKEGFGLVALEAMACKIPVVGSDVGGLSYLLADDSGVLVPPGDSISLSEGILKVLNHPEYKKKLIANGLKRAEEHDQKNIMKKLLEIYRDL